MKQIFSRSAASYAVPWGLLSTLFNKLLLSLHVRLQEGIAVLGRLHFMVRASLILLSSNLNSLNACGLCSTVHYLLLSHQSGFLFLILLLFELILPNMTTNDKLSPSNLYCFSNTISAISGVSVQCFMQRLNSIHLHTHSKVYWFLLPCHTCKYISLGLASIS